MYRCLKCNKEVDVNQAKEKVRCPFCGYRIVMKLRPKTTSKVLAR